jgi:CheY-like chemotaxis protein
MNDLQDAANYIAQMKRMTQSYEDSFLPHIAVVDDCPEDRSELRNFIRAYFNDIPVRTYRDGAAFWQSMTGGGLDVALAAGAIRAIFLDMNMPDMSGFDVLEKIQANKSLRQIPVYTMSRRADQEQVNASLALGARQFIKKPFDKMRLSLAIQHGSILHPPPNVVSAI